jgi:hypothetical protein
VAVFYACAGDVEVELTWENVARRERLSVRDVPRSARLRALALAVAELLRAPPLPRATTTGSSAANAQTAPNSQNPVNATATTEIPTNPPKSAAAAAAFPDLPNGLPQEPPSPAPIATEPGPARPSPVTAPKKRPKARAPSGVESNSNTPSAPEALPARWAVALAVRAVAGSQQLLYGGTAARQGRDWSGGGTVLVTRAESSGSTAAPGSVHGGVAMARLTRMLVRYESQGALTFGGTVTIGGGVTWVRGTSDTVGVSERTLVRPYVEARGGAMVGAPLWAGAPQLELYVGRSSGLAAQADDVVLFQTGGWIAGAEAGVSF